MKKIIFMFSLAFGLNASAQEFYHGIGAQINFGIFNYDIKTEFGEESGTDAVSIPGIVYKATLGFETGRRKYFAISSYPFVGFYLSSQSGGFVGAELPILAEYYLGDLDDNHFFFNGGFTLAYLNNGGYGGSVVGPKFGLGGQFSIGDRYISVHGGYTLGLNKRDEFISDKKSMINLGIIYPIGVN